MRSFCSVMSDPRRRMEGFIGFGLVHKQRLHLAAGLKGTRRRESGWSENQGACSAAGFPLSDGCTGALAKTRQTNPMATTTITAWKAGM